MADVLLRIYEQALAGKWVSPPRKWWRKLYWMARSRASKNRIRARRATPTASLARERMRLEEALAPPARHGEEEVAIRHDFEAILEKASERLAIQERRVLFARVQGLSYQEIAKMVGTAPSTARVHYLNGCSKLARSEEEKDAA